MFEVYRRDEEFLQGHKASDIPSHYMYYIIYSDGMSDGQTLYDLGGILCSSCTPVHFLAIQPNYLLYYLTMHVRIAFV